MHHILKYLLIAVLAVSALAVAACGETESTAAPKEQAAKAESKPNVADLKLDIGTKLGALMEIASIKDIDKACARIDEFEGLYDEYSAAVDKLLEVRPNSSIGDDRDDMKKNVDTVTESCALLNGMAEGSGESISEVSEPEPEPMTSAQENAIESAESYIDGQAFSKSGLIDQLEYEEYSKADAKFAVNHIDVNWNAEAVESAEGYLDSSSFSKPELQDQLEYEGFTPAQAAHGVGQAY